MKIPQWFLRKLHAPRGYVGFNQRNRDEWVEEKAKALPRGSRVLDVGAGPCRYRELFTHCDYHAQDSCQYGGTSDGILRDVWTYGEITYICDAASIPVKDGNFDAILCTELLEHVPRPIEVLKELGRVLRVGGYLFLTAPLGSGLHQQPYHYYGGFTPHFYRKFLPEFGFEIVSIQPNGGFFRHCLQEVNRAVGIIQLSRQYPWWQPLRWLLRFGFSYLIPVWFSRLDDEIFVEEFTVGYHVEAIKRT